MMDDAFQIARHDRAAAKPVDRMPGHERFVAGVIHEDEKAVVGNAELHGSLRYAFLVMIARIPAAHRRRDCPRP
jgi:hypothetical protein